MRLFIAIPVPPDIRRAAADTAEKLKAYGAAGRFVAPYNYHVTMHFIGESDALNDAVEAMQIAARDVHPFLLRMGDYGAFSGKSGGTGFIRLGGDMDELNRLHETLESELWERGFERGSGRFVPHITLGRSITGDTGFTCARREAFTANQLILYESQLNKGEPKYISLHKEVLS